MKALSLWQPWATAVAIGAKAIETRDWERSYRGPVAIHAALHWTPKERAQLAAFRLAFPGTFPLSELPRGAVLAVARIDQVRTITLDLAEGLGEQERALGNYEPGRFAWVLRDVRPLAEPLPLVGRQGLWTLMPHEVVAINERLLREVARG